MSTVAKNDTYAKLATPPYSEAMNDRDPNLPESKYSLVQMGEYTISIDKIVGMRTSCCFFCCGCVSTLKIEYGDPRSNKKWSEKFRFWCNDASAQFYQTKINALLGIKPLQ